MKKVMLVDDAQFVRHMLRVILEKAGYEICAEMSNGTQAVLQYKHLAPDLVIMDINMPDMDGLEALEKIRAIDNKAKVIMVTALGREDLVVKAVKAGAAYFIVKPFTEEKVNEVLTRIKW